jgi:hypothetical protein
MLPTEPRITVDFHGLDHDLIYGDLFYLAPGAWVNISIVDDATATFSAQAKAPPRSEVRFLPVGELAELLFSETEENCVVYRQR